MRPVKLSEKVDMCQIQRGVWQNQGNEVPVKQRKPVTLGRLVVRCCCLYMAVDVRPRRLCDHSDGFKNTTRFLTKIRK